MLLRKANQLDVCFQQNLPQPIPTYAHLTEVRLEAVSPALASPPKKARDAIKGAMKVPTPLKA
jgi:hypothetical protein